MPGSTTSSSGEQSKAKVTDSSATNGIFVRPVAVAGIFRPVEESASKPPVLPEKRRFSTLVGDLKPCGAGSGSPSDDFARRRQSWDTKAKEVPFSQALLKKTPKNTNVLPRPASEGCATNGSSHEDITASDNTSAQTIEKLNSIPEPSTSNGTASDPPPIKDKSLPSSNDSLKKSDAQTSQLSRKELKISKQLTSKNQLVNNEISNVSSEKLSTKSDSTPVLRDSLKKTDVQVFQIDKKESKLTKQNVLKNQIFSTEISDKCTEKKRIDPITIPAPSCSLKEDVQLISQEDKNKKDQKGVQQVSSKTQFNKIASDQKANSHTDSLSISNLLKTTDSQIIQADKKESKVTKRSTSKSHFVNTETSLVTDEKGRTDIKSANAETKLNLTSSSVNKVSIDDTVAIKDSHSTEIPRQPKKVYGLVKRESKIETSSFKTETAPIKCGSKSDINSTKVETSSQIKEAEVPLKSENIVEKISVSTSDSVKNKSKIYGLNKNAKKDDSDVASSSKTPESSEFSSAQSKESVTCENDTTSKIASKVNEFSKAQSPPKDFRTVRRTSDVIAAKIQNIFSNFSSSEKTPILPKKSKPLDKVNASIADDKNSETKLFDKIQHSNFPNDSDNVNAGDKNSEIKTVDKIQNSKLPIEKANISIGDNKISEVKISDKIHDSKRTNQSKISDSRGNAASAGDKISAIKSIDKILHSKLANESGNVSAGDKNFEIKAVNKIQNSKPPNEKVNLSIGDNKISEVKVSDKIHDSKSTNQSKIIDSRVNAGSAGDKIQHSKLPNESVNVSAGDKNSEIKGVDKIQNSKLPNEKANISIGDNKISEVKLSDRIHDSKRANQSKITDSRANAASAGDKNSEIKTIDKIPSSKFPNEKTNISIGDNKITEVKISDKIHDLKRTNQSKITDSRAGESKLLTNVKAEEKQSPKIEAKGSLLIAQDVKTSIKISDVDSNREWKYKQKNQIAADGSSLKKESKLASESSDPLQPSKVSEVISTREVKKEPTLEKATSKTEHLIDAAPSKSQDKKILNIEGKMPIKKQNENTPDSAASLKATNHDDRKSSILTVPQKTVLKNTSKLSTLKTETNTFAGSSEQSSKGVPSLNSKSSNIAATVEAKSNQNITKPESNITLKDTNISKSIFVSQSTIKTSCNQQINSNQQVHSTISLDNDAAVQPLANKGRKTSLKIVNGTVEISQASKIEVAEISPSTIPGIVPTINVLFRTKSPINSATKEENRKKVVVETYCSTSPIPSAVINASKISESISLQKPSLDNSVKGTVKAVDDVKKSVSSPKLLSKHLVLNLKKEELASVNLSSLPSATETKMPPNTTKNNDKCSLAAESIEKISLPDSVKVEVSQTTTLSTDKSLLASTASAKNVGLSESEKILVKTENKTDVSEKIPTSEMDISDDSSDTKVNLDIDKHSNIFAVDAKTNFVDLGDWNKKFQRIEPEPPRVPLRRRALRDSLPPSLPVRSRYGSLKRIDDSPKYLLRSPSQSCLPQRYSYTEMLSKVCSMGVLPLVDPLASKSCSSSSSQVSELWSELSEEQSTVAHTSEMLEGETTERMRLEKEVQELQNRCSQVQLRSDKMEMEMMEARVYRTPELNGDLSEDDEVDGNSSLYKQKYERAVRDMEIMKRRIQQQHEEEIEQKAMMKKASDKRLAEALEDVEEERQVANQWKRKAQKLGSELQDLRLMLEEQMARNGELEKKQRRFDAELSAAQEEIKKERLLREKFTREKDQALHEKYSIEQDLQSSKLDSDMLHEKIAQLNRELDELTLSSKGEEEVTQLKRAKQELERKCRDQEEELEELAAQVSMLEQSKLRLEMSLEKVRQEHRREASVRDEEIEEIRASFSKKIKNLEAQLESEQDERHQLVKQKHELERRIYEISDQPPPQDPEIERRLRRDLKRTKALLRDAQSMLEHTREGQSGKTLIRQLKNQLEDSEFAKAAAVKARQAVEAELQECQTQLEEATRAKNEAESRCLQLSREKSAIQTQLEEAEEEMAEVMKKYKAVVAQMSIDQKTLTEQNQQIADLETEKQMLKDQLSEVSHKFEHLAGQSEDTHKVHRLDGKVRDLESKLELEQTTRSRLEHQIARLKEQNDRTREECDSLRNKEFQAQEGVRRLQRQMRDLREDYSALQQKEAEAYRKQHELEMALENTETDLQVTKNDLRLACQRIQDLQNALEDDLDSGTDVPDDSGSDSDDSFELAMLRNSSVTPTQRCDSAASNYSYASAEGIRSRTSSFTQELSAFSRMMLRRTSMDFLG